MDIQWNRTIYYVIALSFSFVLEASPWKDFDSQTEKTSHNVVQKSYKETHQLSRHLVLDEGRMRADMLRSVVESEHFSKTTRVQTSDNTITLPLSDGSTLSVVIKPSGVLPSKLLDRYPAIRTFRIVPDDFVMNGRLDITPLGFHAMVQLRSGEIYFIDPEKSADKGRYVSYRKRDQVQGENDTFSCGAKPKQGGEIARQFSSVNKLQEKNAGQSSTSSLTYRIAVAATGEYVSKNGGTVESTLAAIATTINRVNQVFEQDLGIHLNLVENNDQLIYLNSSTDPYDSDDVMDLVAQNQLNIDQVIGSENYDIGHLFTTKGGGLAAIASVCSSSRKAKGVSGISNPKNDSFNLDFVAHEIGHQLGATHTFNSEQGLCSGDTRQSRTAFEPGSGSTIMSYAGYCGADNLQSNTDAMLHIGSIQQINEYTHNYEGNRCGIRREVHNAVPKVNAGKNYTIPAQTPFVLTGSASDPDNDTLVFAWQQTDSGEKSLLSDDKGNNALFRVYLPTKSRSRSFPPVKNMIDHTKTRGEDLPYQQRVLNFSFVVQDGYNSSQSDDMKLQVIRTGSRFALNLPQASYNRGDTQKIYWNVANTDKPPINCTEVNISLSTDGGYLFDQKLATNISNTGEAWVTIPSSSALTSRGRFKLECSGNIFFAISYRDFIVKDNSSDIGIVYVDENQPELNLEDRRLGENGGASSIAVETNAKASGGSISYFFLLFLMLIPIRRSILLR